MEGVSRGCSSAGEKNNVSVGTVFEQVGFPPQR